MTARLMSDRGGWFAAYNSLITGNVKLGEESSVWFNTVLRGDDARIEIGKRVNLQDFVMVHPDPGEDLAVGDDVIVGHRALLHCRRIGSGCVIGMGAILLPGAVVGDDCYVAAGALVTPGTRIESGFLALGAPAKPVRRVTDEEREYVRRFVPHYVESARKYCLLDVPGIEDPGSSEGSR